MISKTKPEFDELVNAEELKRMAEWGADSEMIKMQKEANRIGNNKLDFEEELDRIGGCRRYLPCPVCYKCGNKASHLYVKCQQCKIPTCVHTYNEKDKLIRRGNFAVTVNSETAAALSEQAKAVECLCSSSTGE